MSNIEIRPAQQGDAEAISLLIAELGYELSPAGVANRLHRYQEAGDRAWVAVTIDDSTLVGFLSFHLIPFFHAEGSGGRITAMCVSSTHRRRSVGHLLMQEMEKTARGLGCLQIEVTSGDHRESEAHRFYEAEGYALSHQRFLKKLENQ